ncbi:MAG TPA: hypothetical protein VF097_04595 [Actinomycetota bacterium]
MTTIRATCPRCGEVEMSAASVLLVVEAGTTEGTYRFVCPSCEDTVEKRADRKVVMLLLSAGVEVREVSHEVVSMEHPSVRSHQPSFEEAVQEDVRVAQEEPAFTLDDLIDFHFLLQQEDWFDELARSAG